ncbi:unnamed protein product [Caenorhabditis sp. 36 PRJEB53466]|nr:unnamed protein product [Caenorhabditis sp. 36 PRJEB53466]
MYIKTILLVLGFFALQSQFATALYLKRAEFDDPRLFTSSFGKRSGGVAEREQETMPMPMPIGQKYYAIQIQRREDLDDPRFLTMSFGKRSLLPSLADLHRYTMYDKRGLDIDDPRFFSGAFGKK